MLHGSEVWYHTTKTELSIIERTQNMAARQIQGLHRMTHSLIARAAIGLHSIESLIDRKKLMFFSKTSEYEDR